MGRPILLVEDNEDDVFFFKRAMEKAGLQHPLRRVEDGQQAIDYLRGVGKYADRSQFPLPCLVLLDLKLPRVSGLEVVKWIREQPALQTLVVIILTSSHLDVDVRQAYRLGANSFLVKTSSANQLANMVRLIHEYWLELNLPPAECAGQANQPKQDPSSKPS